METSVEPTINVHVDKEKLLKFEQVESGLYLFRTKQKNKDNSKKKCLLVFDVSESEKI